VFAAWIRARSASEAWPGQIASGYAWAASSRSRNMCGRRCGWECSPSATSSRACGRWSRRRRSTPTLPGHRDRHLRGTCRRPARHHVLGAQAAGRIARPMQQADCLSCPAISRAPAGGRRLTGRGTRGGARRAARWPRRAPLAGLSPGGGHVLQDQGDSITAGLRAAGYQNPCHLRDVRFGQHRCRPIAPGGT
jgi:hypothetical protein